MTVSNVTPPVISGTAQKNEYLTTSNGTWTFSLDYLTYAYQWERCDAAGANCVNINGATSQSYLLTTADVGSTVRVVVTATEHATPPPGTNYYVATTGNDSTGTGAIGAPWKTVKKACDTVTSGQINVAAGTYVETGTCTVRNEVSLVGAGSASTIIRASSSSFSPLMAVTGTSAVMTLSDFRLDGQSRTTTDYGLVVTNVSNLTLTDLDVRGFKGPNNHSGGGINIFGFTDSVLKDSNILNSGGPTTDGWRSGALGLGAFLRSEVHDCTVSTDNGYAVKAAQQSSSTFFTDSAIWNCTFVATSSAVSGLTVELYQVTALNSQIYQCQFDGIVSLTGPQINPSIGNPKTNGGNYRWRLHHNFWDINDGSRCAVEMSNSSMEVDHNYVDGPCIYPWSYFESTQMHDDYIHHNVTDHVEQPIALSHFTAGVTGFIYEKNTVIVRTTYQRGVFNLVAPTTGVQCLNSIFNATSSVGDNLGILGTSPTIDGNIFYQITPRGTNSSTANPALPLAGGFPAAYTPPSAPANTKGAFADGTFSVGPQ